jgi:hypothetical protein
LVGSNDDDWSPNNNSGLTGLKLTAGTTYRIAVDGFGGCAGDVTINWVFTPAVIPSVTLAVSGVSMVEAGGSCTVTASLSAVTAQDVTIDLAFSGTAALAADYAVSATSMVIPAGSKASVVTLTAVQDTLKEGSETVVVEVISVANALETIPQLVTVNLVDDDLPPANDNFLDSEVLSSDSGATSANTLSASTEVGEPLHAGRGPFKSIWYKFTPASSGKLVVNTHGSTFDTVLAMYTGSAVGQLTKVASNDDDSLANGNSGLTAIPLTGGVTCWIAVAGYRVTSFGDVVLNWSFTPAARPSLVITTPHGLANLPNGTNWFSAGSSMSVSITNLLPILGGTQFVCRGWTGTGSVPASGTSTSTPVFALTNNSTITWTWQTNCLLNVNDPGNGTVSTNSGWFPLSTNVVVTATPSPYFTFKGWKGETNGCVVAGNNITVVMNSARTITPLFDQDLATNNVPQWWLAQYGLTNFNADAMQDADHDGMLTWQEWVAGSDPLNPDSVFHVKSVESIPGQGMIVRWPSVSNRFYNVSWSTNLLEGASGFMTLPESCNISATPPENVFTNSLPGNGACFFKVDVRE